MGDVVAKWLACWTPDQEVWVQALAGPFVLCFWARHFTLTVDLSTQGIMSTRKLSGKPDEMLGGNL